MFLVLQANQYLQNETTQNPSLSKHFGKQHQLSKIWLYYLPVR